MAFFMKRKGNENRSTTPQERHRLTDQLMAGVWSRRDEEGNKRVAWSLDRVNPQDMDAPFRTLTVSSLLEAPSAILQLAEAFAALDFLPQKLRKKLAQLSAVMAQVIELSRDEGQVNGEDDEESTGSFGSRVLAR